MFFTVNFYLTSYYKMSVRSILDTNGKISTAYLPAAADIDLISPINLFPPSPFTSGVPAIIVNGNNASEYGGSISLNPSSNSGASAQVGVNIKSAAAGCEVEVGTNGAGIVNTLSIAGVDGLSQVYDGTYNQPVALPVITFPDPPAGNPAHPPEEGNTGEVFRTTAFTGVSQQNVFTVAKAAWYGVQTEVRVGGTGAVLPIVAGVPAAIQAGISSYEPLATVPYQKNWISAVDLLTTDDTSNFTAKVFTTFAYLVPDVEYAYSIVSTDTTWNLGVNGQIKAELICFAI
jgi:hypothetical protein